MVMTNKYPGRCTKCGGQVGVAQGIVDNSTGKWRLYHRDGECFLTKTTHASGDFGLAKNIDGYEFKPDASPTKLRCARCGTTAGVAWIAGAGEALCYRHQDDY